MIKWISLCKFEYFGYRSFQITSSLMLSSNSLLPWTKESCAEPSSDRVTKIINRSTITQLIINKRWLITKLIFFLAIHFKSKLSRQSNNCAKRCSWETSRCLPIFRMIKTLSNWHPNKLLNLSFTFLAKPLIFRVRLLLWLKVKNCAIAQCCYWILICSSTKDWPVSTLKLLTSSTTL